uniref:Uncharacterized protein n=1 Tax=Arundo donax TaxID=35708 RepID=A0A0A9D073_ARUDO
MASDLAEAPLLWAPPAVAPAREEMEGAAAFFPPPGPAAGKGSCAVCGRPMTLRCKRCKSVKYWSVDSHPSAVFSSIHVD